MRRLRHAVSRPCDAFRAVLEPLLSCASYAVDGAAATHPVLRRADRRRVEPTAPSMRRLGPPAGCGGCSVRGKPGRCLRVRHHCPCAIPRGRSTGLGVAGFTIRSRRDRHRPRASPRSPNGPIRARLKPPGSPAATPGPAPSRKKRVASYSTYPDPNFHKVRRVRAGSRDGRTPAHVRPECRLRSATLRTRAPVSAPLPRPAVRVDIFGARLYTPYLYAIHQPPSADRQLSQQRNLAACRASFARNQT